MTRLATRLMPHSGHRLAGWAIALLSSLIGILFPGVALAAEGGAAWPPDSNSFLLTLALSLLVLIGLTLMAIGSATPERASAVAVAALAAVALSLLGYLISGFALQFGGVGLVSQLPGLEAFQREWLPWGPGWGILGLRGFLLSDPALDTRAYAFFLIQWLPALICSFIPLTTLAGKAPRYVVLLSAFLTSAIIYPLFGNWVWGGGWLANLGQTQNLGHGLVDLAGATGIFVLGAGVALAALCAFRLRRPPTDEPPSLPPAHFPLFMIAGAFLALAGWNALVLSNPLAVARDIHPITVIGNILFAAAGGLTLPLLYTWFVTGRADAWMMARGLIAGLVAGSASAAFVPNWAAWLIGAAAGAVLPLATYFTHHVLKWDDDQAVAGVFLLPGLWGLLAVGLFSSGRWGIGWNGIGANSYLGQPEQGVTGLRPAAGFAADWPGQFQAQLAGALAALILSFLLPLLLFRALAFLQRLLTDRTKAHPMTPPEPAPAAPNAPPQEHAAPSQPVQDAPQTQ